MTKHDDIGDQPLAVTFAAMVGDHIIKQKVSRSELARRLETSPSWVTKFLNGENVTLHTVDRVARVLGCRVRISMSKVVSGGGE